VARPTPTVGQTLYDLNVGNAARRCEQKLTPVIVVKVGRKYFFCKQANDPLHYEGVGYHLSDWAQRSNGYTADHYLFASEQEWLDDKEAEQLERRLCRVFSGHGRSDIPLANLRAMVALLPPTKET